MAIVSLLNFRGVIRCCSEFSLSFRRFFISFPMNSKTKSLYEEAVYALNGLQSNALYLQKAREQKNTKATWNLIETKKNLNILGIQDEDLDALNAIHVSGTKGKGSTCAFTESIIRHHGFKTGFYSSPHLISVNERIRINGQPLDKELFSEYFWEVYGTIKKNLKSEERMPPYFQFLTVLAFYVFVKEKVQAAIVEVGIGGLYDCTNILRKPVVTGVASLGMDHVNLLGNKITEIAEQKAGIFKKNVPAFTVSQPESAMEVLRNKAQDNGVPLRLSPPFEFYQKSCNSFTLCVPGNVQNLNASLALQLSKTWLDQTITKDTSVEESVNIAQYNIGSSNPVPMAAPFDLTPIFENGLQSCEWPGRFQTLEKNNFTFYLDGAHTQQSIKHCAKWFEEVGASQIEKLNLPVLKVLVFNCTGDRKAEALLGPLSDLHFDIVLFSPNRIAIMKDSSSDLSNFMVDPEKEMEQCVINKEIWCHLKNSLYEDVLSTGVQSSHLSSVSTKGSDPAMTQTIVFPCLSAALNFLLNSQSSNDPNDSLMAECAHLLRNSNHVQVLVTGSLHLIGGVLSLMQT